MKTVQKLRGIIIALMAVVFIGSCDNANFDKPVPPDSVSLNQPTLELSVREQAELHETVLPLEATNKSVNWTSSNDRVAVVTGEGRVSALNPGLAIITVSTRSRGKTATCVVTVTTPRPTNVNASADSASSITVTWDEVEEINSYRVYRADNNSGNYRYIADSNYTSYTDTGLTVSTTYYYKVTAVSDGAESAQSYEASATTSDFSAPTNVSASANSASSITITWSAVSGAASYKVYRASSSTGNYSQVGTAYTTSYTDTGTSLAANTTYYYKVSAISSNGSEGVQSSYGSATTSNVPSAPTGISAATVSASSVTVSWTVVSGAASYNVYRASSSTGPFAWRGAATGTSYTDTGTNLVASTTYFYKVSAVNSDGSEGAQSSYTMTMFAAPTNVTATASASYSSTINLSWTAVSGASLYKVYRASSAAGPYEYQDDVSYSYSSYADTYLTASTTYYYKVSVVNSSSMEGLQSDYVSATTYPDTPTNVSVTGVSANSITLGWYLVVGADSYKIYRSSTYNGTYSPVGTAAGTTPSYTNTGLSANTAYYYKVSAVNSNGSEGTQSSYTNTITPASVSGVPTNVIAAVSATTPTNIIISWDPVDSATTYTVYRSAYTTTGYTPVSTGLTSTSRSYTDSGLTADTLYFYRVTATVSAVETDQSSYASVRTPAAAPSALSDISAAAESSSSITVSWYYVANAGSYRVYRAASSTGTYTLVGSTVYTGGYESFTDTGLSANTTYYYKVSAVNASGTEGEQSTSYYTTTRFAAPTGVSATAASSSSITISWTLVSGASSYRVYRASSSGETYYQVGTPSSTSYTDTSLESSTMYFYKVSAVNSSSVAGDQSSFTYATTLDPPPSAPYSVSASADSASSITVSWYTEYNVSYYKVYRANSSYGTYSYVGDATDTSYTDTGLSAGTTYYYKVSSVNASGTEGEQSSNYANATTYSAAPSAPTGVYATASSSNSIYISWSSVTNASYYIVYRASSAYGTYNSMDYVYYDTSYTDYGLSSNTTYYYKVSAVNSSGTEGDQSSYTSATTSSSSSPGVSTDLSYYSWSSNTMTAGATHEYRFYASAGQNYYIECDDSDNSSYTADVKIGIRREEFSWYIFDVSDTNDIYYYCDTSGYIIVVVQGYSPSSTGTYRIRYYY